jgi:hypothetical protein
VFRRHLALCRECHGTGGTIRQDRGVGRMRHAVGASARRRGVEAERPVGSKTKRRCGQCQNNSVFSTERGRTAIGRVATGHGKGSRLTSMRGTNVVEGCAGDTRRDEVALVRVRVRLCRLTGLHLFFSISPAKDTRVKNPQIYLRLSLVLTWLFLCLVNRPSILGSRWYRLRKTTIRGFIGRDIFAIISP